MDRGYSSAMASSLDSGRATLRDLFVLAARHHQAGRLAEAERHYRELLRHIPAHAQSRDLLGLVLAAQGRMEEAAAAFRQAVIAAPDFADAYNNFALAERELGRPAPAALRRAIGLRPDYAEAHNNLGLLGAEGGPSFRRAIVANPGMAEAYGNLGSFRRAAMLQPGSAAAQYNHANALRDDMPAEAWDACRRALVCRPDYGQGHSLMGLMLMRRGDLLESARRHRRALTCEMDPVFFNNLASVGRFEEGEIAAMERLAESGDLAETARIELQFALGKAYDDRGDAEAAFRHYLDGNARQRRRLVYDEAAALDQMERMRRRFEGGLQGAGHPSPAPIFILGMPRSGSTLIEQILASHRQVEGGGERTDFPELAERIGDFHALGAAYLARSPRAGRFTDKLPLNFLYAGAIHLAFPNARIIHSRRHPADTCLSCFTKLFTTPQAHTYDLGELGRYYRAYEALMDHWRSVLPATVFLDVDYEALVADPETQTRRLLDHCGLAWDPACLTFHQTEREVRTASAAQVRRPLYSDAVGRWRRYGALLEPLLGELGDL